MKKYSIEKITNAVLSYKQLHKMSNFATAKVGKAVQVVSKDCNSCYSTNNYWNGLLIQLGRNFYAEAFHDKDDVDVVDLKSKYRSIAMIMFGAYYHELFHLLYTPFGLLSDITYHCNYYFQQFVHQVANILEDVTIEGTGMNRYPYSEKYIMATREVFKQPTQIKLITESITEEPDNPGTLLGYLLHFCRGTDMSQFPEYKLWEDNKEFIEWGAYKCINTIDPTTRAKRQAAYALELTKILDMKAPDKDNVENPDMSDLENQSSGFNKSSSGKGSKAIEQSGSNSTTMQDNSLKGATSPQESDENASDVTERKASRSESSDTNSSTDPCNNIDLTKAGVKMLANDEPLSRCSHYADKLSTYKNTKIYLPNYNAVVKKNESQIRNVVATIRKMIAVNNSGWSHFKMTGKLDMSTIYKKGNYKVFKKKNEPAPTADLVFEILVDNSGSMHGTKAKIAGEALIVFCEALNRLHIPFSVDCFTEANHAITISLKDFNESYEKTKTNMTLMTEQFNVDKLGTWCGNYDEINLRYVADELALRPEKDKVIVVISDGATCGDFNTLKKVAENIEADGITILGIGIYDDNVSRIYKNNTILRTSEDLEGLSQFLNKYLIGKIFK